MPETSRSEIVRLDERTSGIPYTPMDAWATADPIVVARAEGAWLEDVDGRRYLDGNSSWWVAALGHGHPRLLRAFAEQARTLAHCALGGIAHEPAARLAEELVAIAPPGLRRVFYVDNGSTAIDAAVKMCVQGWRQLGAPERRASSPSTARSTATRSARRASAASTSFGARSRASPSSACTRPSPRRARTTGRSTPWLGILEEGAGTIAAVFVEPIVQGTSGMRIYDAAVLRALRDLCDRHDVWLVVDEVFTGYGRTGPMWACEHAGVTPDIMCIGKVFSSIIPMGAVLATERVFDAFRGGRERAFLYGHTFCGNPLGAALAREVLAIYRDERVLEQVARKAPIIARAFERMRDVAGVERVRTLGMIGAADLAEGSGSSGYLGGAGWRVYEEARKRGAYLRPLGNTVYVARR